LADVNRNALICLEERFVRAFDHRRVHIADRRIRLPRMHLRVDRLPGAWIGVRFMILDWRPNLW